MPSAQQFAGQPGLRSAFSQICADRDRAAEVAPVRGHFSSVPGHPRRGALLDAPARSPYVRCVTSPYRDENESLRAEVTRLREELAKHRSANGRSAVLLVGVDFLAVLALRPWLNGASDMKFWMGLTVVVGIALAAIVNAVGVRRG